MTEAGKTVGFYDPRYSEALEFLYREAALLDTGRFSDWLGLMAEDITYRMPVRVNRKLGPNYSQETEFFSENIASLRLRVERLGTEFAWAEIPSSRTRHLVTNVRVQEGVNPEDLDVFSYVLVYRNRSNSTASDLFSGERQDLLRRVGGAWRLAKRIIFLDQAVVGANLSIFL